MLDEQIYIHFKGENLLYYQIKYHQNWIITSGVIDNHIQEFTSN